MEALKKVNKVSGIMHILYHIVIVVLSAAIALSLPLIIRLVAMKFLIYWSFIENEKIFLISVEIVTATLLILLFNYIGRSWKDRRLSAMAKTAGLCLVTRKKGFVARGRAKKLKEKQGIARDVMIIGSTGFSTFVAPDGDLHHVVRNCREAKIMLLDPFGEGAITRARSINSPLITPEIFREQIMESINFLKGLKSLQINIRLKLYPDAPLFKLAVLGDYLFVRHYHTGLEVSKMPEYVFRHDQNAGSLYSPFYQYFLSRWSDPDLPEYDLDTGELIYRDSAGNEIRREQGFENAVMA